MSSEQEQIDRILHSLTERTKELNCLYRVEELLTHVDRPLQEVLQELVEIVPQGWQFTDHCRARLVCKGSQHVTPGFIETDQSQESVVFIEEEPVGRIEVAYIRPMPRADEGPFLKEERKLLDTIAELLGKHLLHRELRAAFEQVQMRSEEHRRGGNAQWWVVLEMLRRTDRALTMRLARKMINHLFYRGIGQAKELLARLPNASEGETAAYEDNRPHGHRPVTADLQIVEETFLVAAEHIGEKEILACLQEWISEDKLKFLMAAVESSHSTLVQIVEAVDRYRHIGIQASDLSRATQTGLRVSLVRRLFTEDPGFLSVARRFLRIRDFYDLIHNIVLLPNSRGKLGGKSSGLFLAYNIVRKSTEWAERLGEVRTPKTWYIPSDALLAFIHHNELEDVHNWKYMDVEEVRREYPFIVQAFKDSRFPPDLVNGLSLALDDLEGCPLIVRSSSLLEDRIGAAFSGKYKSLFLANQGSKRERLAELLDAIAEVYSSILNPDPIEYRAERGLLDVHEEMAIMIQEVVGRRVGRYWLPMLGGVAFSRNEFRWSPRIRREDGLARLVPGLGTRAVDRVGDDFPVLVAPGQPGLRASVTPEEVLRYSPRKIDLINLETRQFETVDVDDFLKEVGHLIPDLGLYVSLVQEGLVRRPVGSQVDPGSDPMVFTFEGLLTGTPFLSRLDALLKLLEEKLGTPVDIEFAHDGKDFFLVQCRPQSYSAGEAPAPIPHDIPGERLLFNARRYISNGSVKDITHIVYVDPESYDELANPELHRQVGRIVGKLNKLLPKRQFVLMGPGRWGSRGDSKLGVPVTYSEINNTAMLIEIARKKGNYTPDLSFGTHFFQDLVEASIRYLPLYPDDEGIRMNELFLRRSPSILSELCPGEQHLQHVVRVIDLPEVSEGLVLQVLMNADLEEAVGVLGAPERAEIGEPPRQRAAPVRYSEDHWRWRLHMAERLAAALDAERFGVKGLYVFGSTKNATAGPGSDIDLLVHFAGDERQRSELSEWLQGWSLALAEVNFLRTGYRSDGLLDYQLLTDEDIARQTSFAIKIGAVTDAARPLSLGRAKAAAGPGTDPA